MNIRMIALAATVASLVAGPTQAQETTKAPPSRQQARTMAMQGTEGMMQGGMQQMMAGMCRMMQGMQGMSGGMMKGGSGMQGMMGGMTKGMSGMQGMMGGRGMSGGMMQGMMGGQSGMMGTNGMPGPGRLLAAREALELTAEQISSLEQIRTKARDDEARHAKAAREAQSRAVDALAGDSPDLSAYEAALQEAARHHAAIRVAGVRAALEARDLLTPEQRATLRKGMRFMHGMMGGMTGHGAGMPMPHAGGADSTGAGGHAAHHR